MVRAVIDGREVSKMLKRLTDYSNGFIKETAAKESYLATKTANTSIAAFYEYLDMLARSHPGMLHHVYEWGQVGNPSGRLFEMTKTMGGNKVAVSADFLPSSTSNSSTGEAFEDKATIMEEGITVVINEVEAQALFFEIDGTEYFRAGPIVVENPGGPATRGAFVEAFNEFYAVYFDEVYLKSIRYYDYISKMNEYYANVNTALRSSNAGSIGRKTALSWIMNIPGDDYE